MRIRDWMTRDPVIVNPETLLVDARKKMDDLKIHHLPVVKKGKLVGMLTRRKVLEASPSSATTLSMHELSYLLARMTVADVMIKDPVWVTPDTPVEDVVLLGYQKGIGSFPVVENGKLVGIATAAEVTRGLLEIFAAREEGVLRLTLLEVPVDEQTFPKITEVLQRAKAIPLSIFSLPERGSRDRRIIIRCKAPKQKPVINGLKEAGFKVEKVVPLRLLG
ncbi:MAG: CBS domain-containing protein [Thermodesulfobacteriota bacterium]